jgi:hypothetical protein
MKKHGEEKAKCVKWKYLCAENAVIDCWAFYGMCFFSGGGQFLGGVIKL